MNSVEINNECNLIFKPTTFGYHAFATQIADKKIIFQAIKMKDSVFIFVNYADDLYLVDLSLAMLCVQDNTPLGTQILGDFSESISKNIAMRLSKKLNKLVYVSCNTDNNRLTSPTIEKCISEEIKLHPNKF